MPKNIQPLLMVPILLMLYLDFSPSLLAQKVLFDHEGAEIVNRAIIIPKGEFNLATAEALCRQFVSEQSGKARLYRLSIGRNVDDWQRFQGARCPIGSNTPEGLVEFVRKVIGWPKEPIAQVIGINKQAMFSYRDQTGLTDKLILGNSDPTLFRIGSAKYKLMYFFLNPGAPELNPNIRYDLKLYFQGPRVGTLADGVTFAEQMAILTGTRNVFVRIHRNAWLMDDDYFPFLYPFVSELSFPKPSDYSDESDLFCNAVYNRPTICKYGSTFLKGGNLGPIH